VALSDIIGQVTAIRALENDLVMSRVAHAYMFEGPEGTGKRLTAVNFIKTLTCPNATGTNSCDKCRICIAVDNGRHPEVKTIQPQGASLKIEQIREILKDCGLKPVHLKIKAFILDGIEKATPPAANTLLRVLEEPPDYVVFLLMTHQVHAVLPTLISRCRLVRFGSLPPSQIADYLVKRTGACYDDALLAARLSGGTLGQALRHLETGEIAEAKKYSKGLLSIMKEGLCQKTFSLLDRLATNREIALLTLEAASEGLREGLKDLSLWSADHKSSVEEWVEAIDSLEATKVSIARNANLKLALEVLALRLAELGQTGV